ncbi:MAG: cytochrome P450 [Rhodobacteraceae bacterium]|nr:cytochrome P450 [Paracoccaceae bacterium]
MERLSQSPTARRFVQNPYPFYERARAAGPFFVWEEYGLPCTGRWTLVNAILRDRRFGREAPSDALPARAPHTAPFYAVDDHSMLELEPPRHTRLRSLVLRAFTSARINALGPEIEAIAHDLIDRFPAGEFDLLPTFAQRLPIVVIARLMGVPEQAADDMLAWSHAMVGMYQAGRSRAMEEEAARAAGAFAAFIRALAEERRTHPRDDLVTRLVQAEAEGSRLSMEELVATCILLLNAGHEATVHSIGNAVRLLLRHDGPVAPLLEPDAIEDTVEECLRLDPPLHLFTRWVYEEVEMMGHVFAPGEQVGLLLAAAGRDPAQWERPARFRPTRPVRPHLAFGAGLHFCLGAPLARLELAIALPALFGRCPGLRLVGRPRYADVYHFHGLERLTVATTA